MLHTTENKLLLPEGQKMKKPSFSNSQLFSSGFPAQVLLDICTEFFHSINQLLVWNYGSWKGGRVCDDFPSCK